MEGTRSKDAPVFTTFVIGKVIMTQTGIALKDRDHVHISADAGYQGLRFSPGVK